MQYGTPPPEWRAPASRPIRKHVRALIFFFIFFYMLGDLQSLANQTVQTAVG